VAGNVFTVSRARESTLATSHSDGATVTAILTKGSFVQYNRDRVPSANEAIYRVVDETNVKLETTDFTEVNFTDNAVASSTDLSLVITKDDHVGASASALVIAAPSTPYTLDAAIQAQLLSDLSSTGPKAGLCFRESATGKIITSHFRPSNTAGVQIQYYTSPTVTSSTLAEAEPVINPITPVWLRLQDDGTDLDFWLSVNGSNWQLQHNELRGANFTTGPDQIGFFIDNIGGVDGNWVSLVSWFAGT
jgi:hypothetical protein